MLLLTATNQSLELVTGTLQTIDFVASFVDITTTTLTPGSNEGTIASSTTTTIVPAPAGASTQRQIKHLTVRNTGALLNLITIQKDSGGTNRTMFAVPLAAGESLEYVDGAGFHVFDINGNIKVTTAAGGGASVPTGTGFRHVTGGAEDAASKLVDTADINNAQVTFAKLQSVGTDRLIGRDTALTGDAEELTVSGGIEFTGAQGIQTSAFTGNVTKAAGGTVLTIPAGIVTNTMLATMSANSLKGNNTGAAAAALDLTVAQVRTLLGAFSSVNLQAFTTAGANTYTPTAGMKFCIAISTGAGGGGGGATNNGLSGVVSAGGGGGAGGTCIEAFSAATIGASQTVTIGTGGTAGTGGATGGTGGTGGNTTFGALHTANGGAGGVGSGLATVTFSATLGGAGGTPTGGLLNVQGGQGGSSTGGGVDGTTDLCFVIGGDGGTSFWGGGGRGATVANASLVTDATLAGNNGTAFGSGGGGAADINNTVGVTGGAGANGVCLVLEFV